ncbi:hypothetical protein [Bacillus altitudinis]|nr:hypothetical protein [Bacillus altitudinis]
MKGVDEMGRGFWGVRQLAFTGSDDEIVDLDQDGVKGLGFNVKWGGWEDI